MSTNILVVVIDALRADRVGALGGRHLTPNIDRLASDATVFTNAFSTTNATDPAITSLHSGLYPLSHGVVNHGSHVTDAEKATVENVPWLPEVLADAGYYTTTLGRPLGRWHRRGFEHYPSILKSHWRKKRLEKWASDVLHRVSPRLGRRASSLYSTLTGSESDGTSLEDRVTSAFEHVLDRDSPFYTFVHLMNTHTPYEPKRKLVEHCVDRFEYENTPLEDVASRFPEGSITRRSLVPGGVANPYGAEWRDTEHGLGTAVATAHYDAAVMEADSIVGDLLDALSTADQMDETLIIVMSDHGESLAEHGIYYEHHGLYDQTIQIPLVVRPPSGDSQTRDDMVQITDIAPTVLSYAGANESRSYRMDGNSLRPMIEDGSPNERDCIIADEANTQRRRAIRTDERKVIYALEDDLSCRYCEVEHAPETELYDLTNDPAERINLADDRPAEAAELRERASSIAESYLANRSDVDEQRTVEYEDEEEVLDRLESLGYR